MRVSTPVQKHQHANLFSAAFLIATIAYSLLRSWLGVLPGTVAFGGGFLLSYSGLALLQFYERRRHFQEKNAKRMDRLIRLLEESVAEQTAGNEHQHEEEQ